MSQGLKISLKRPLPPCQLQTYSLDAWVLNHEGCYLMAEQIFLVFRYISCKNFREMFRNLSINLRTFQEFSQALEFLKLSKKIFKVSKIFLEALWPATILDWSLNFFSNLQKFILKLEDIFRDFREFFLGPSGFFNSVQKLF